MSSVVITTFLSSFLAAAAGVVRAIAARHPAPIERTHGARQSEEIDRAWPRIRDAGGSPHVTAGRTVN
jgi:hypothetical protein